MPGTLIEADWQAELRGKLYGAGTVWTFGPRRPGVPLIEGWHSAPTKSNNLPLRHDHGSAPGRDFMQETLVTLHLQTLGTPAACLTRLRTLEADWRPGSVDEELHLRMAGGVHEYVVGRPYGLGGVPLANITFGQVAVLAHFLATDPIWRPPEES